jgi:hypothetical protein
LVLGPLAVLGLQAVNSPPARAADPDPDQLIRAMKEAIEPSKPSTRVMSLTAAGPTAQAMQLVQARKVSADGTRALTFLIHPDEARGMAYLIEEKKGQPTSVEYIYVPVVRRVRKLVQAENYRPFMDTDFTYSDLGFLSLQAKNRYIGDEPLNGKNTHKVESIPTSSVRQWYYSKYVTWIDADTHLPIKREFYSPADELFKVETFDDVTVVDGVPTPTRITMQDRLGKTSSELKVISVSYNNEIPDDFFTPEKLPALEKAGNAAERAATKKK